MTDRIPTTDTTSTDMRGSADYEPPGCWACDTDRELVCGTCGTPGSGCCEPRHVLCTWCWNETERQKSMVFPTQPWLF
jgi:hypothetical protein